MSCFLFSLWNYARRHDAKVKLHKMFIKLGESWRLTSKNLSFIEAPFDGRLVGTDEETDLFFFFLWMMESVSGTLTREKLFFKFQPFMMLRKLLTL